MENDNLIIKINDKIIKMKIKKKTTKCADSCHVILPKQLLGKVVLVEYVNTDKEVKNGGHIQ